MNLPDSSTDPATGPMSDSSSTWTCERGGLNAVPVIRYSLPMPG